MFENHLTNPVSVVKNILLLLSIDVDNPEKVKDYFFAFFINQNIKEYFSLLHF